MDFGQKLEAAFFGVLALGVLMGLSEVIADMRTAAHRRRLEESADRAALAAERQMAALTGIALANAVRSQADSLASPGPPNPWGAPRPRGSVPICGHGAGRGASVGPGSPSS